MQRLGIKKYEPEPNEQVRINLEEFLKFESHHTPGSYNAQEFSDVELISLQLIPSGDLSQQ